ncbi:sigma-70 family RNA polymerase sigma factor [Prosthecomicrobium hirschii]|jgi:RNA polymerase sigma factor (sigma-70 family)|nr:sigma-70 family RNA polymerase sigma factor [Prosthecomicrobium hirschii]MCW1842839.1 sigma-70 family RNA polymerase sigma factor [Prosthecomicrobium hirschii]
MSIADPGRMASERDEFADLVERIARHRDREAFGRLFDHFTPRLEAYLIRLGSDAGSAEELAQEAMVTLWRKAALFDRTKSSVGTWLYRIARNRRIDAHRRNRDAALDPEEPLLQPSAPEDADEIIDARRREDKIRVALAVLPPEQIELVRLAFYSGLSHSQIAEQSGLPLGTVKSRIRLAFSRLRKALEDDGLTEF